MSKAATVAPGTHIGPYEVVAFIGAGGMGEVYRARDTRLDRMVAIKVLQAAGPDPGQYVRFEREARAIAALNHPHICGIYDVGHQDGASYLVLEYLEGETLAQRLMKGPIPFDQVLQYAIDIADALDKAHRAGIVHRDLKPGNVMLTRNGVKLLDFGLAKTRDAVASLPSDSGITQEAPLTGAGALIGTLQYMAPEQLEGKDVDARTDIFVLGEIIYEMATGKRPFEGGSPASIIAAVLDRTPLPVSSVQSTASPLLDHVVKTCLAKDPDARWQSANDVRRELEWIVAASDAFSRRPASIERPLRRRLMAGVAIGFGLGLATAIAVGLGRSGAPSGQSRDVIRSQVSLQPAERLWGPTRSFDYGRPNRTAIAITPDGRSVVFTGWRDRRLLYVRSLDDLEAKPLEGTEGGLNPFVSPDGRWIGYWTAGEIRKVPVSGGPSLTVCPLASAPLGATWTDDDHIIFGRLNSGLWEVSSSGGTAPVPLTTVNVSEGEVSHRLPHAVPNSDAVIYTASLNRNTNWREARAMLFSRGTRTTARLVDGGADAQYVASGHLVYVREGVLMATPFDLATRRVTGNAAGLMPVMQAAYHVGADSDSGAAQFGVSQTGTLAYVPGGVAPEVERSLVWVDRSGRVSPLSIPPRPFNLQRLSADDRRIAVNTAQANMDIWVVDIARGTMTRLTGEGRNATPVWMPDGSRIVYRSSLIGPDNLFWRPSDGSGAPERLTTSLMNEVPASITADGGTIVYYVLNGAAVEIWALPLKGPRKPRPLIQAAHAVTGADLSPDGRWLAYASNESGRFEVYVQALGGAGAREQVSSRGGTSPVWRRDGRELFFIEPAADLASITQLGQATATASDQLTMMATPIDLNPALHVGAPKKLFDGEFILNMPARSYDVTADGQRFLMLQELTHPPTIVRDVILVQNWFEELKKKSDARPVR